ncbi:hypothetical protein ABK040_007975 [Willaertia magna]
MKEITISSTEDINNSKQEEVNKNSDILLYKSSPITLESALTLILHMIVTLGIAKSQIDYFLKSIKTLLPKDNNLSNTKISFYKHFDSIYTMTKIHYCSTCKIIQKEDCCLNYSSKYKERIGYIRDVYNGSSWKVLKSKIGEQSLFLQLNLDGISLFKSSKFNIWSVFVLLLDISSTERYKEKNIFLYYLWFEKTKPNSDILLNFISQDMKRGEEEISNLFYKFIKTIVAILQTTMNLPAKALFYMMNQFNGANSCGLCCHSGIFINNRYVFPMNHKFNFLERTEQSIIESSNNSEIDQTSTYNGIKKKNSMFNLSS